MEKVKKFEDLKIWQKAHQMFNMFCDDVENFPNKKSAWVIADQGLRSIGSISANITEGYGSQSGKEFVRFLMIARRENSESLNWLIKCRERKFITEERFREYANLSEEIRKMINSLVSKLRKNSFTSSLSYSFTLIEILVASFIFVVAVLATFSAFYSTTSFQAKTKVVRETTQEARNVIETLTREIRLADGVDVLDSSDLPCSLDSPCPVLKITKDGVDKKYKNDSGSHKIILILDSTSAVDVTTTNVYVSNLSFTKKSDGGIQIQLTIKEKQYAKMAEKGVITLKTTVYRRGYK